MSPHPPELPDPERVATIERLRELLRAQGVRPDAVALGEEGDEAYSLTREGEGWSTFYAERGEREDERLFAKEAEACTFFYSWVLGDPTVRERPEISE